MPCITTRTYLSGQFIPVLLLNARFVCFQIPHLSSPSTRQLASMDSTRSTSLSISVWQNTYNILTYSLPFILGAIGLLALQQFVGAGIVAFAGANNAFVRIFTALYLIQ